MTDAFLSLGSNLGDRQAHLEKALERLVKSGVAIRKASRIYETVPVEVQGVQDNYLNMVVEVEYEGEAMDLLDRCQEVESALGRARPYVHAPRTIDIDILLIRGVALMNERLVVPHPRLEDRAFVIHPLAEIAPGLILPSGRTAGQVKKTFGNDEIVSIREYAYG